MAGEHTYRTTFCATHSIVLEEIKIKKGTISGCYKCERYLKGHESHYQRRHGPHVTACGPCGAGNEIHTALTHLSHRVRNSLGTRLARRRVGLALQ